MGWFTVWTKPFVSSRTHAMRSPSKKHSELRRPTRRELEAAYGGSVPDLVGPNLRVLFCGINPSLYSVAVGHHFARPGNRFWATLHRAGFTERTLRPAEERELLARGIGITNVVNRATASAAALRRDDYLAGAKALARKVRRLRPAVLAFVGIEAYRIAARQPHAAVGEQSTPFAGARVWVLPNPSGLNAHYQLDRLAEVYGELAQSAGFRERAKTP
jgi:double-stranded uracil-DNA glycosylase